MTDTVDKIVIQSETQGVQQSTNDVQGLTKAMDGVTVASQNVERSTGTIDSKFAALERRFSTTAGQATALARVQKSVNDAVAANPALQDRANEVLAAATARYGTAAAAEKALGDAHAGLNAQGQAALHSIRSVVEQLALGIPPTQALTGQLNHLTFAASGEGGLAGAFRQVGSLVGGLVTSINPVIAGTAALTAAAAALALQYDKVSVSAQRAISGAGQRTGTSVSDINAFVAQNSGLSGTSLSSKEARGLAEDFTKTGEIVISRLHGMSDAVVGFANQTGKSIDEAKKDLVSFAVDPKKGLEELSKTYGSFDVATRKAVDALVLADDKTGAFQVVIDALADKSKSAAGNMGILEKATRGFVNILATETVKPVGLEQQLENVRSQLNAAIESASDPFARDSGEASSNVERLSKDFADLSQAVERVKAANASSEFNKLSTNADNATKSLTPQIDQLEQVRQKIEDLNRAREKGAASKYGAEADNASLVAAKNLEASLVQSQEQAARYNERVKEISASWGDVGQQTALSLQSAENQLPVLEAVGGAAKMAAQETADYKNYMDQGKTSTEAAALAASNLAAAQAQVNSGAANTLASLRDQYAVASARNPLEAAHAQAQATFNDLLRQGVDSQLAMNIAAQQEENARAAIYVQMEKAVRASRDAVDLAATQGTAEQANVKARIAYNNAIDAGATSTQAAIIANNAGAVAAMQWAENAQKIAEAYENAARAAEDAKYADAGGSFGNFSPKDGITGSQTDPLPDGYKRLLISHASAPPNATTIANNILATGSVDSAISAIQGLKSGTFTNNSAAGLELSLGYKPGQLGLAQSTTISQSDIISLVGQLYTAKNSQTTDKSVQAANLQQELAWLQSQPQSLDTLSAISSLKSSIESLTKSTDSLNSTNQDLLSPYYSQDPRTSHIGFRSQGMATGGEFTVPGGYSANDNMLAQIPVASGEIVSVRRPGQELGGTTQNIVNLGGIHITVQGGAANTNAIGRTVYQETQAALRQFRAATK